MAWQAESVGIVLFPGPSAHPFDALTIWRLISPKVEPDSFSKPPGGPMGVSQAGGSGFGFSVAVVCQPGRLQATLSAIQVPSPDDKPMALIDDVVAALSAAVSIGKTIAAEFSPVRLAVTANLAERVEGFDEAAKIFSQSVPNVPVPAESSDLQFQINVRKVSKRTGHTLNRVCRWGTGQQQIINLQITAGPGAAAPPLAVRTYATAYLHTDVNTTPVAVPFEARVASDLLDDALEETTAIIKSGVGALINQ